MPDLLKRRLQQCSDLKSVLDRALGQGLEVTGTVLGNIQLMDWTTGDLTIEAQRGFNEEFLKFFRRVTAENGSACARAIRERDSIVVGDVLRDWEFAPYRTIALESGFRAVQSTPLISSSGAFVGVLSTHFAAAHRPSEREMRVLKELAQLTANAIIRLRAGVRGPGRSRMIDFESVGKQISRGYGAVADSYELLRQVGLRFNR